MKLLGHEENPDESKPETTHTSNTEFSSTAGEESPAFAVERKGSGGKGGDKATGPRTQLGKQRSSLNALKLGIFSKVVVLKNESQTEFEDLLDGLCDYLQPEGTLEQILVEKLAALFWRERRLIIADSKPNILKEIDQHDPFRSNALPEWDRLLRYETSLDRAIDRTLNQLERYQRMRLGQPVPPPVNVNVTSS